MHKIKLKLKEKNTESLIYNLNLLNFIFGFIGQKENRINIVFYSQHQIERFLNITKLEEYKIQTYVEKFESLNKIVFNFSFCDEKLEFINNKLKNYIK